MGVGVVNDDAFHLLQHIYDVLFFARNMTWSFLIKTPWKFPLINSLAWIIIISQLPCVRVCVSKRGEKCPKVDNLEPLELETWKSERNGSRKKNFQFRFAKRDKNWLWPKMRHKLWISAYEEDHHWMLI